MRSVGTWHVSRIGDVMERDLLEDLGVCGVKVLSKIKIMTGKVYYYNTFSRIIEGHLWAQRSAFRTYRFEHHDSRACAFIGNSRCASRQVANVCLCRLLFYGTYTYRLWFWWRQVSLQIRRTSHRLHNVNIRRRIFVSGTWKSQISLYRSVAHLPNSNPWCTQMIQLRSAWMCACACKIAVCSGE